MLGKVILSDKNREYSVFKITGNELTIKAKGLSFAEPVKGIFYINGFTQDISFTGFVSDVEENELKIKFIVEKNKELMLKGAEAYFNSRK